MKFSKDKAPFTLGTLKFNQINLLIQAALLIIFITSLVIYNSFRDDAMNLLINGVIAIAVSLIVEFAFAKATGKFVSLKKLMIKEVPLVIPLTIVLLMPLHVAPFIVIISTIIGTFVGKLVYGGYGFSIFNPAIVGTLFAHVSFNILSPELTPEGIEYPLAVLKQAGSALNVAFLNVNDLLYGGYYGISVGSASALLLIIVILLFNFLYNFFLRHNSSFL
ncbi:RnfABCDGE type electron transport complex subunit D [Mycoplasmatota bacterium WC44]